MEDIKLYGKSLLKWFVAVNTFSLISIVLILSLQQTKEISGNGLGANQFIITILAYIVGFYFFKKDMETKSKIEIKKDKINFKYVIIYGIILTTIGIIGDYIVNFLNEIFKLIGFYFDSDNLNNAFSANNAIEYFFLILYVCIIAPILEELIFRGYTINLFKKYGKKFAIIISSLMFGIMHAEYMQIIPAILGGIILSIIFFKTNDIRVSILCHAFNNIIALIFTIFKINNNYVNLIFIILSIIIYLIFNKREKLFEITKDIKKERFSKKDFLSSWSLILFIFICLGIAFSQIKFN